MLQLKGCPRCRGDMYLQPDLDTNWWICLQCGHWVEAKLAATPATVPANPGSRQAVSSAR